jgi:Lamin Tail Domain
MFEFNSSAMNPRLSVLASALVSIICLPVAAEPEVLSVNRGANGVTGITVTGQAPNYYILWRSTDHSLGAFTTPEAVKFGNAAPLLLNSAPNNGPRGFYKVQEVLRTEPLDVDNDGLPDTWELQYSTCLNPLNPADAALDSDGDGRTALQEFAAGTDPCVPQITSGLVINEMDYDQTSTDTAEFVELHNTSALPVALDGLALVFINGATNVEYRRVLLTGTLPPGAYAVGGSSIVTSVVPPGALTFSLGASTDAIQNGAPDGVLLMNLVNNTVVDALSYEGSITAGVVTGAGTFNLVEGAALPLTVFDNQAHARGSLIRQPNGTDTNNAASDWLFTTTGTPGEANVHTPPTPF